MRRSLPYLLVFAGLSLSAPGLRAAPPATFDDYQRLQQWRYRAEPIAVPANGLRWNLAGATWTLESGRLWLAEPTAGGAVTGLVFEGRGRFHMDVPDAVELAQLRRFVRRPDLAAVDEAFTACVLRFAGGTLLPGIETVRAAGSFAVNDLARQRHMHWLTERREDEDARILAALDTPGDQVLRVDVKTADFGWLTWDYDERRIESIRLLSWNTTYPALEVWLSLRQRAEANWRPAVDVEHADIAVDLTRAGREKDWIAARFRAGLRFTAKTTGGWAVQLWLNPLAEVTAVREGGRPLRFVRDAIGRRSRTLDNRIFDRSLLVLLDQPLVAGEPRRLDVEYELQLTNYVPGRDWYPGTELDETFLRGLHTARLEITATEKQEVRAIGKKTSERRDGEHVITTWDVDHPVKMVTFTFARNVRERFDEVRVAEPGVPEVICFGPRVGLGTHGKYEQLAHDVAASVRFFSDFFAQPLPGPTLLVTTVEGLHGQSFDGFLQLSTRAIAQHGVGAGELFRAHEVAHQWWGHLVGPATYRDAWLGESLAEYSALLYVEAKVDRGAKIYGDVVRAYTDEMNGSIASGFSEFSNPQLNLRNHAKGDRAGPIGLGWRASPGELPTAYASNVYSKGPLVLHMLRSLLRDATGGDDAFRDILRDFARTHRGGYATTRDFAAAVSRHAAGDWSWFFAQWIDGTAIPVYRWSYTVAKAPDGAVTLALKVRQSDVPDGFRMPVPVRVDYADGTAERRVVIVARPEEVFQLALAKTPKSVVFDPDGAVLAKVSKE